MIRIEKYLRKTAFSEYVVGVSGIEKSKMKGVRPGEITDIERFLPHIRPEDIEEILSSSGLAPATALATAFLTPETKRIFSVVDEAHVLAMFGVKTVAEGIGYRVGAPWMICSDELLQTHRWRFLSSHRDWFPILSDGYTMLENYVYAKNQAHIEWLQWAGFELIEYIPEYGAKKVPFWRFRMTL